MLRHLKMELKRQQAAMEQANGTELQLVQMQQQQQQQLNGQPKQQQPRRVRGRRSSKPMMEKRRRARINECLDILKSYVLTDSTNLSRIGIDVNASENQDEETIARSILKSSGLINRHRGRKNPNKLEKADILELTVDYVRRLHEQRNELLVSANRKPQVGYNQQTLAVSLSSQQKQLSPLTLSLPAAHNQATVPPTPPPSSASCSPQPLLSISMNNNLQQQQLATAGAQRLPNYIPTNSDILDLSDSAKRSAGAYYYFKPTLTQTQARNLGSKQALSKDGLILIESADGCWRPWNPTTAASSMALH